MERRNVKRVKLTADTLPLYFFLLSLTLSLSQIRFYYYSPIQISIYNQFAVVLTFPPFESFHIVSLVGLWMKTICHRLTNNPNVNVYLKAVELENGIPRGNYAGPRNFVHANRTNESKSGYARWEICVKGITPQTHPHIYRNYEITTEHIGFSF